MPKLPHASDLIGVRLPFTRAVLGLHPDAISNIQRRAISGRLYGEFMHPKRGPGLSDNLWFKRIGEVSDEEACVQIKQISVREVEGELPYLEGRIAVLKGKYHKTVLEGLQSGTLRMGMRGFTTTDHSVKRVGEGTLITVVTWDVVVA